MLRSTAGMVAVNAGLPKELRDYNRVLNAKAVEAVLKAVAKMGGDAYRDVSQHLLQVGKDVAQATGGDSFGPEHLRTPVLAKTLKEEIYQNVQKIYANAGLSRAAKADAVVEYLRGEIPKLRETTLKEAISQENPLATQIISGSRGNPSGLQSLLSGDLLYADHRKRPIPVPILHSYSQGLSPLEFYASTFGARRGALSKKLSTRSTGYYSKMLRQATHRLVVEAQDLDESVPEELRKEYETRGLPTSVDDPDNEGSLLAMSVGGYPRNTILTPQILADLKSKNVENILVRSVAVGGTPNGGVYANDAGIREKDGGLPPIGDFIGISSADALGEPVTQAALGEKHSGGTVGKRRDGPSGFELFDQFLQVPKTFKGGAAHAQTDGKVTAITKAPQGGHYITINGVNHYIGHGYEPAVAVGGEVEAGDVLSDGIPNPAEIVKHKGIGEGRRYFVQAFTKAYKDSDVPVHRRNVEQLARSVIDHVEIEDEIGDWAPGDTAVYSRIENEYKPRKGFRVLAPAAAKDQYLERPVLHYSIGTKLRPSVIKTLRTYNVPSITVHDQPPPFKPKMIRALETLSHDPDWMTRMLGSYLKRGLLDSAHRGDISDENNTSFVPALARAEDYGKKPPLKGWAATGPKPTPPTPAPSILAQMQMPEPTLSLHKAANTPELPESKRIPLDLSEILKNMVQEFEPGHTLFFDEDDDAPDDELEFPVAQYRLSTHVDESGDDLAILVGETPGGKTGILRLHRPGCLGTKTKVFHNCGLHELDQICRAMLPWLAEAPTEAESPEELVEFLKRFAKPDSSKYSCDAD